MNLSPQSEPKNESDAVPTTGISSSTRPNAQSSQLKSQRVRMPLEFHLFPLTAELKEEKKSVALERNEPLETPELRQVSSCPTSPAEAEDRQQATGQSP